MDRKDWKPWLSHWNTWYWETSKLVGAPLLLCLMLVGIQKTLFTGTCALAGYQCEYGFGSVDTITNRMTQAISPTVGGLSKGEVIRYDFTDVEKESMEEAQALARKIDREMAAEKKRK